MSRFDGGADSAGGRWHRVPPPDRGVRPPYRDGCHVISSMGEATTWAICQNGRWGIVYECGDRQVLSAWVDEQDLPLHVLAAALHEAAR